jgi:hypothetical protein
MARDGAQRVDQPTLTPEGALHLNLRPKRRTKKAPHERTRTGQQRARAGGQEIARRRQLSLSARSTE